MTKKLYYMLGLGGTTFVFQRCNVDGTDPQDINTPTVGIFAINAEARTLYWSKSNTLYRSDLNGQNIESHSYSTCCIFSIIAFDESLFFVAGSGWAKGVYGANPDGSNEELLAGTGQPLDLAYDPVDRKMYLATINGLFRLNYDGSGFENLGSPQFSPTQVVIDRVGRKLYWTDTFSIQRANLDGSNVESFLAPADGLARIIH